MAIKLIFKDKEVDLSPSISVKEQLNGCDRVKIDFDPNDKLIEYFLDELEDMASKGLSKTFNIKVTYNNDIRGARAAKKVRAIENSTHVNELIKMIVTSYDIADRKLEEIQNFCTGKNCKKV